MEVGGVEVGGGGSGMGRWEGVRVSHLQVTKGVNPIDDEHGGEDLSHDQKDEEPEAEGEQAWGTGQQSITHEEGECEDAPAAPQAPDDGLRGDEGTKGVLRRSGDGEGDTARVEIMWGGGSAATRETRRESRCGAVGRPRPEERAAPRARRTEPRAAARAEGGSSSRGRQLECCSRGALAPNRGRRSRRCP